MTITGIHRKLRQFQRAYRKLPPYYRFCLLLILIFGFLQVAHFGVRLVFSSERHWEIVIDSVCSKHSHTCFYVSDSKGTDGHVYRQMIVKGIEIDVESQVRLIQPKGISEKKSTRLWAIDHSWLASEYLRWMLVSPFLTDSMAVRDIRQANAYDYLFIGLGGGSLPSYIRYHMPQMNITVVEVEKIVKSLAIKWFDFTEDSHMRCTIDDGIDFLDKSAKNAQKFDAIMLDACDPDKNAQISCPFSRFYDMSTIRNSFQALKPMAVNVLTRQEGLVEKVSKRYSQVFPTVIRHDMKTEANALLICLPYSLNNFKHSLSVFRQRFHALNQLLNLHIQFDSDADT